MQQEKAQYTIPENSQHSEDWLQQISLMYCVIQSKKQSFFEGNWLGEDSPSDIKQYWATLTDTERAIQILERTDAAVYMEFVDKINRSIPV
jgi:hypothetical protein